MTTIRTKWFALSGVVCAGGVGAWLFVSAPMTPQVEPAAQQMVTGERSTTPASSAPSAPRLGGCAPRVGEQLAYAIFTQDRATLDLSGLSAKVQPHTTTDVEITTRARLELRVLTTNTEGSTLLGRLAPFQANTIVEDEKVEAPFLLRISADCAVDGFAHQKGLDAGYARVQQAVLHELSWMWPTGDSGRYEGRSAYGAFAAELTRGDDGIDQVIDAFEPWSTDQGALTRVISSHQRVVPGAAPWFTTLDARASYAGARSRVEHTTQARLVDRRAASLQAASTDEIDYVWADLLPQAIPLREPQPPSAADLQALDRARELTVDQAVEAYVERVEDDNVGIKDTWPPLRTFLEAKPDTAEEIIDRMRRAELPSEATMGVYIALGNARTPQARAALWGVLHEEDAPVIERSRAILALLDRDDVGIEFADYLKEKSSHIASGASPGDRVLARQALLALGAMAGRKPLEDGIEGTALAQVARLLEQTRDKSAAYQRPVFGALANVGEPESLKLVADIPDHPDPDVREAAAIVFRRMPPVESADFAARWLDKETNPNVKRTLWNTIELQTFDAREMTSLEVLKYAVRDLREKPGFITRKALIRLLARAKSQMPDDELGIEDLFAELIPFEFKQDSGFHRMMDEHIEPKRREEIYTAVARSFQGGPSTKENSVDIPDPLTDNSDSTPRPGGFGLSGKPAAGGGAR